MQWLISLEDNQELDLTSADLLETLLAKQMKGTKDDHVDLSNQLTELFQQRRMLKEASIQQLVLISFSLGYYYRVFLEKNKVRINSDTDDTVSSREGGAESSNN